jgi:MFS transporter, DHA1 family, multidrug resistance protein
MTGATASAPPRHLVFILLLVIPLSQIPLDVYTPALPRMAIELDATSTAMQNTVTAYMLGILWAEWSVRVAISSSARSWRW